MTAFVAERLKNQNATGSFGVSPGGSIGNLMVAAFAIALGAADDVTTITDAGGNTWTKLSSVASSLTADGSALWVAYLAATPGTVTVSKSGTQTAAYKFEEFSGSSATPADGGNSSTSGAGTATSGSTPNATPAGAGEMRVAVFGFTLAQTSFTPGGSDLQAGTTRNVAPDMAVEYLLVAGSGSQNTSGSWPTLSKWTSTIGFVLAAPTIEYEMVQQAVARSAFFMRKWERKGRIWLPNRRIAIPGVA